MGFRDKFRKKADSDDDDEYGSGPGAHRPASAAPPEFTFIRTDTHSAEVIRPPSSPTQRDPSQLLAADPRSDSKQRLSLDVFRSSRSRSTSESSQKGSKRLSQRLHLSRSPSSSENVPEHLPEIVGGEEDNEGRESQWEKRATMLARENEKHRSRPGTPTHGSAAPVIPKLRLGDESGRSSPAPQDKVVSSKAIDEDIQEAIRLHEEGELEKSTALFGRLADPKGANNPLSQVLYGLALRYVRSLFLSARGRHKLSWVACASITRGVGVFLAATHRLVVAMATPESNCPMVTAITKLTPIPGTDGGASRILPKP